MNVFHIKKKQKQNITREFTKFYSKAFRNVVINIIKQIDAEFQMNG